MQVKLQNGYLIPTIDMLWFTWCYAKVKL